MSLLRPGKVNGSSKAKKIVTGLDIGTSKVCALVASPDAEPNTLNILGIGITESEGLNRGVVSNIDKTVKTIKKVIDQAEQQSGIEIKNVIVGIAGDHIQSREARGVVTISNQQNEISKADVLRVIEDSKNMAIPQERQILHVIPQEFIIDGQYGITDPVGMYGLRMEAIVHVVTGAGTAINNIVRCIERVNIEVDSIVLEPIASSYSVLEDDEKEVGVAMIDIGGGTTDIAIFQDNIIRFTSIFGIGGKQVTDDIRKGLGIIATQAEKIKREFGHCYMPGIMRDDIFMIPGIGGRKPIEITKKLLCQIIQPRMEEIYEFALAELRRSGLAGDLGAGIVLTGGCALLRGAEELAQEVFGMPVKIGAPSGISYSGLAPEVENPIYSTAVGLALFGLENNYSYDNIDNRNVNVIKKDKKISIFEKVKKIFDD
jgi:cell division protein FtsA